MLLFAEVTSPALGLGRGFIFPSRWVGRFNIGAPTIDLAFSGVARPIGYQVKAHVSDHRHAARSGLVVISTPTIKCHDGPAD